MNTTITEAIAIRARCGESAASLMDDFNVTAEQVQQAIKQAKCPPSQNFTLHANKWEAPGELYACANGQWYKINTRKFWAWRKLAEAPQHIDVSHPEATIVNAEVVQNKPLWRMDRNALAFLERYY